MMKIQHMIKHFKWLVEYEIFFRMRLYSICIQYNHNRYSYEKISLPPEVICIQHHCGKRSECRFDNSSNKWMLIVYRFSIVYYANSYALVFTFILYLLC